MQKISTTELADTAGVAIPWTESAWRERECAAECCL